MAAAGRVDDDMTAVSQEEMVQKHAVAATKGKTYGGMDRDGPAREVAFSVSALRTAL